MTLARKLKPFYFTIRVKQFSGYGREFRIMKEKSRNSLGYAHELHGLVFNSPEETEKEILEKLKMAHGRYTKLNGKTVNGIKSNRE